MFEGARVDAPLNPTTAARLVADVPPLPDPWPAEARDLLVRLLAAGPGSAAAQGAMSWKGKIYGADLGVHVGRDVIYHGVFGTGPDGDGNGTGAEG